VEHLPQRLGRLEAMARRERHPPGGYLLRGQLADATLAEDGGRLGEQPTQLLDRDLLYVVLGELAFDQRGARQRARDAALPAKELDLALASLARVLLGGEPASLDSLRAAAADAKPVGP